MGSDQCEDMMKKQTCQHTQTTLKLKILFLLLLTNLFTVYIVTSSHSTFSQQLPLPNSNTHSLLLNLKSTQDQLLNSQIQISDLQNLLQSHLKSTAYDDLLARITPDEARLAIGPHKLPLGNTPRMGTHIYSSVGGACLKHKQDLDKYMSYEVGGTCPSDDDLAQTLMLRGCEPLPRRRCHPKSPANYAEPTPLPKSLWSTPPDSSIVWDPYTCKNYSCLIERKNFPKSYDCKDCFDLEGREKTRWVSDNGGLDFGMDEVLKTKPGGSVRIGLDIGGGSGTFAARMRERGVTIVTTSMNFDGPFNSFIASRGLIPMHVSVSQRLPFFENTLDVVHSMHVLSNWIPEVMLEGILYDVYRVLRPGGLFWVDRFFCLGSQLNRTYVPLFQGIGFTKLRWNTGMKLDRGVDKDEWYFSALLEKPMT